MTEFPKPAWLKEWVATQVKYSSNYSGLGMFFGGICAAVARLNGAEPSFWFFIGFAIAPGLAGFIYSTDFVFEKRLDTLKRWRDAGTITEKQYEEDRQMAMDWRASRLYGITEKPARRSRPKPRPRAVEISKSPGVEQPVQASPEQPK